MRQGLRPWNGARGLATSNHMATNQTEPQQEKNLRQLYPHLNDYQLAEANENLRQYVALGLRVFKRLELDPKAWARFETLTASRREPRMSHERPQTNPAEGQ